MHQLPVHSPLPFSGLAAASAALATGGDGARPRVESLLRERFGGAVILKGSGTLVATEGGIGVCGYGNPGMASGGMGDVLSGVLGGLLAQGLEVGAAAGLGACLHGRAADVAAARDGERGLLATDLLAPLRRLANGLDFEELHDE